MDSVQLAADQHQRMSSLLPLVIDTDRSLVKPRTVQYLVVSVVNRAPCDESFVWYDAPSLLKGYVDRNESGGNVTFPSKQHTLHIDEYLPPDVTRTLCEQSINARGVSSS
jgi:hypothetical protein